MESIKNKQHNTVYTEMEKRETKKSSVYTMLLLTSIAFTFLIPETSAQTNYTNYTLMIESGTDGTSFGLVIFLALFTIGIFLLPMLMGDFFSSPFINTLTKRGLFLVGLTLIPFDIAILTQLMELNGLVDITQSTWVLFDIVGIMFMIFLLYIFVVSCAELLELWRIEKTNKRMGGDYYEH